MIPAVLGVYLCIVVYKSAGTPNTFGKGPYPFECSSYAVCLWGVQRSHNTYMSRIRLSYCHPHIPVHSVWNDGIVPWIY